MSQSATNLEANAKTWTSYSLPHLDLDPELDPGLDPENAIT